MQVYVSGMTSPPALSVFLSGMNYYWQQPVEFDKSGEMKEFIIREKERVILNRKLEEKCHFLVG
jgi:hypothetical protein